MSNKTPLYEQHCAAGGQMVDFFGWDMPLHYGSQLEEHRQVRADSGVFDVSHMVIVDLLGAGGRNFLHYLLANNIDGLEHPGQAFYSCMLNANGGIVDDLIVYYRTPDNYRLVLNAATREKDLAWIQKHADGLSVGAQERNDLAMVAVQGPKSIERTLPILAPAMMDAVSTLGHFEAVEVDNWFFARTGYTGENGLEIMLPAEAAADFWQKLLAAGVKPCGLGARDTLRLEAGLMLYGQDMDESVTPLESALGWTVAWEPADRDFIGRAALELQRSQGVKKKLVGLILEEKGVMRAGQKVIVPEVGEGVITSGAFSPTLSHSIAFARVPTEIGQTCLVEIRDKQLTARVVKPRFV